MTGSGENSEQNQGRSWCSFSGLNDDPSPIGRLRPERPRRSVAGVRARRQAGSRRSAREPRPVLQPEQDASSSTTEPDALTSRSITSGRSASILDVPVRRPLALRGSGRARTEEARRDIRRASIFPCGTRVLAVSHCDAAEYGARRAVRELGDMGPMGRIGEPIGISPTVWQ